MKTIFLDIQAQLSAIPELHYVGENWGQLNFEQPPVNWPCCLIDLGDADFKQLGKQTQQADATLQLTLADIQYNGVVPALPQTEMEKAFLIFDIIEKINTTLHGHGTEQYSRLIRTSIKKIERDDLVREFLITYKFAFTDESARPEYTKVSVPPDISVSL